MPNAEDITGKLGSIRPRTPQKKPSKTQVKRKKQSMFRSKLQERQMATDLFFYGVIALTVIMITAQFLLASL